MKIIGIDYGTKRIGVAISDETQTLAREYAIWPATDFWEKLDELLGLEQVEKVIVGLPLNMSGVETEKTKEVKEFIGVLKSKINLPVDSVDERLSSVMAEEISGQSKQLDSLSAQIFLQNYLNQNKTNVSI